MSYEGPLPLPIAAMSYEGPLPLPIAAMSYEGHVEGKERGVVRP
jgi:hypothetical protein